MRNIVLVFLFFFTNNTLFSQRQNRGILNNNNTSDPKPQKFDAAKIAGIFYFEEKKTIKKIKVKKDEKKKRVLKIIQDHNTEIQKILFLKNEELNSLNTVANSLKGSQNREAMIDFRTGMQKIIQPIRDSVKNNQENTNLKLKEILNKKQYGNWIKHVKRKRKELLPKRSSNRRPINNKSQNRRR